MSPMKAYGMVLKKVYAPRAHSMSSTGQSECEDQLPEVIIVCATDKTVLLELI